MIIKREWAMPDHETFSIKPIGEFVKRYLDKASVSIDPFARNKKLATWTNDLSTDTSAMFHMDAGLFCKMLCVCVALKLILSYLIHPIHRVKYQSVTSP